MTRHRTGLGRAMRPTFLTLAGVLGLAAQPAWGQALDDKYWLEVSGYWPSVDSDAIVSRPGQPGTKIDLESDLGLEDDKVLPAGAAGARFGRFVVQGEIYALDRRSTRTIERDILFDGVTYPATASVASQLDSNVYRLTLGYVFLRGENAELGAAVGLHATDFALKLEGQAQVGAGPGVQTQRRQKEFLAPQPTVGLFATYEPTPKIVLNARVDYLSLSLGDYGGGIFNTQASVAYRFNPTFQVGAAWRYVAYDLDVKKDTYTAKLDYGFNGPSVFLRVGFR